MRLLAMILAFAILHSVAQEPAQPAPGTPALTVPAGTTVVLGLTSPVWAKSARPGDNIYAETTFPVAVNDAMAIPAGTNVKGKIDILLRPGTLSPHAEFRISFSEIVYANGYTVPLSDAFATLTAQIAARNDVLLDDGSPVEMIIERPLELAASSVAAAVRVSKPPKPRDFRSASQCRPIAPTEGTSDTVIPGTPGTPPTVIPGGPGTPPTVIPGTPGTPATVIPGTPGSPEIPCPGPPQVTATPAPHVEPFRLSHPAVEAARKLAAGNYEIAWEGLGPPAQVRILKSGNVVATLTATVIALGSDAPANDTALRTNPDSSSSIQSIRFKGRNFALEFNP